ncbi:MAG: DUF3037 domain-containing protein [Acidobacteriota bacterium]|nr:DUF3037 domain-containing protein [Acidobacteriota bacterium]
MPTYRKFEFFVLSYAPHSLRNDAVNIGVLMMEAGAGELGFANVSFTRDWRGVLRLDPGADIEMLQAIESDIRIQLTDMAGRDTMLRRMRDSFSNVIRLSSGAACLAEDPKKELERLVSSLCDPIVSSQPEKQPSGRKVIRDRMTEEFEQAGIMGNLMRDIAMSAYTQSGDRMKLDFGYNTETEVKFFQAVSLKSSEGQAILLAARFPELSRLIEFATGRTVLLTAVIDEQVDSSDAKKIFALDYLRDKQIRVTPVAQMPKIAELARRELVM